MRSLPRPARLAPVALVALGAVGVLALAACSTDPVASEPPPKDEMITVTSEFGDVEIPSEPQRALVGDDFDRPENPVPQHTVKVVAR